jgi:hypothetical protein
MTKGDAWISMVRGATYRRGLRSSHQDCSHRKRAGVLAGYRTANVKIESVTDLAEIAKGYRRRWFDPYISYFEIELIPPGKRKEVNLRRSQNRGE